MFKQLSFFLFWDSTENKLCSSFSVCFNRIIYTDDAAVRCPSTARSAFAFPSLKQQLWAMQNQATAQHWVMQPVTVRVVLVWKIRPRDSVLRLSSWRSSSGLWEFLGCLFTHDFGKANSVTSGAVFLMFNPCLQIMGGRVCFHWNPLLAGWGHGELQSVGNSSRVAAQASTEGRSSKAFCLIDNNRDRPTVCFYYSPAFNV